MVLCQWEHGLATLQNDLSLNPDKLICCSVALKHRAHIGTWPTWTNVEFLLSFKQWVELFCFAASITAAPWRETLHSWLWSCLLPQKPANEKIDLCCNGRRDFSHRTAAFLHAKGNEVPRTELNLQDSWAPLLPSLLTPSVSPGEGQFPCGVQQAPLPAAHNQALLSDASSTYATLPGTAKFWGACDSMQHVHPALRISTAAAGKLTGFYSSPLSSGDCFCWGLLFCCFL